MAKFVLEVSQVASEEEVSGKEKSESRVLEYMRHHSAPVPRSTC